MLVHDFLENASVRHPDKTALVCGGDRLTYRQVNQSADRVAAALSDMGIRRQDRVVLFLDNSAACVISLFGVLKAGAVFSIINPAVKPKKLNYILKDSGARALFAKGADGRIIREAIENVPDLENIIWVGNPKKITDNRAHRADHHIWENLMAESRPANHHGSNASIDLDLAAIIYTSGSTGLPKGVMSAHYNMVAASRSIAGYLENVQDDIIFNVLPLSFDYGLYQVIMAFSFGGTVILDKTFMYPFKTLECLMKEKATGFPIVPTMAAVLIQMDDLSKFDFGSLRYITNTAAALPVSYIRKLQNLFPRVKIYSMYGLTECKRVSYLHPDQLSLRPESVGKAMPNVEVLIVDREGKEVAAGEIGELVVRGSNVMQGYWNAPEETIKRFRPGKYRGETLLYTGDLFKRDEEGYLYFIARQDDLIKTKGERVSPKEIENVLCEMDGIVKAAVIGVADDVLGQAVKAFIVKEEGRELTKQSVLKHCRDNLEPFIVPKYVEFRDSFPLLPGGKIDKKALAEAAESKE